MELTRNNMKFTSQNTAISELVSVRTVLVHTGLQLQKLDKVYYITFIRFPQMMDNSEFFRTMARPFLPLGPFPPKKAFIH